jgi:hypothetical protein
MALARRSLAVVDGRGPDSSGGARRGLARQSRLGKAVAAWQGSHGQASRDLVGPGLASSGKARQSRQG